MLKKLQGKLNNQKGFTLVELIVVLAILGILAAIIIPRFTGVQAKAKLKSDQTVAYQIAKRLELEFIDDTLAEKDFKTDVEFSTLPFAAEFTPAPVTQSLDKGSYYVKFDEATGTIIVTISDGTTSKQLYPKASK